MSTVFGYYGPRSKRLGKFIEKLATFTFTLIGNRTKLYRPNSSAAKTIARDFQTKLNKGKTLYIMGIGPSGHNTGIALIEASLSHGIRLLSNHEEERFTGKKHCADFPNLSIEVTKQQLSSLNLTIDDIHCIVASWDYIGMIALSSRTIFEHAPQSLALLKITAEPTFNRKHLERALRAPRKLRKAFQLPKTIPIIGMEHHHNHAYFSYAVSPFIHDDKPVMITVLDGTGDKGAISLYLAENGELKCIQQNNSIMDSLGLLYCYISATQGGWSLLSSEGRYMGAAAWGNMNRLTNPYYQRLRQILYFGKNGAIKINRDMAHWHISGQNNPYKQALIDILGEPIAPKDMWHPDAILSVEDIEHFEITQQRLDKAAALQLIFEDALFHIVGYLIQKTGADCLVMSGGTALNCIANMKLLEQFDEQYYQRYLAKQTRLQIWIPPIPGDPGAVTGAAYQFAMQNGVKPSQPLTTPFLCGIEPTNSEIKNALETGENIKFQCVGNIQQQNDLQRVADFMAYTVSQNGVIGIYQGKAETGPRALGHRSILANPCNSQTLSVLNAQVKFREKIRPLAPMVTIDAAKKYFELSPGAAIDNYHAYDYMVLTVRAKQLAYQIIPAVIHHDGTSRIQIVREQNNALSHAYLLAMKRYCGVEVSVNTSLNVGSPIVQTPQQAVTVLSRAKAMDGLFMVGDIGDVWLVASTKQSFSQNRIWHWYDNHNESYQNSISGKK